MRPRTLRSRIERLEGRLLLTGSIVGSDGDDSFVISVGDNNAISLIFNGVPEPVSPSADGIMEVHGFGGNDTISLLSTGTLTWYLFGEAGDDQYNVGNGDLKNDIHRDVFIGDPLGLGSDTTTINDLFGGGTTFFTHTDEIQILSLASPFIGFQSMVDPGDGATLLGSSGDDRLIVRNDFNSGLPENTYFDLGDGDDTVDLGGSQHIVPDLPSRSTIDAGGGSGDVLNVDDSNPDSPRTGMSFSEDSLGFLTLKNFVTLNIKLHERPSPFTEIVTFVGPHGPAAFVNITEAPAPNDIRFALSSQNGWGDVVLIPANLASSVNLTIGEDNMPLGASWNLDANGLLSSLQISISSTGRTDLFLGGTSHDDVFTIQKMPDWNVTIAGQAGDDKLRTGTNKNLLDVFRKGKLVCRGGDGVDTLDLSDEQGGRGLAEEYLLQKNEFQNEVIQKRDPDLPGSPFVTLLTYGGTGDDVENVVLRLDNDPDRVFLNAPALQSVEIYGNGGNDTFFNGRADGTGRVLPSNLAARVTLHGGSGSDILSLDDTAGPSATYSLNAGEFVYSNGSRNCNLPYEGMETIDLFCSNQGSTVFLIAKPAGATLNFGVGDGDDAVYVGGGDLDSSGLLSSGMTISGGVGDDSITFDDRLDNDADGQTSNYAWDNFTLAKGTVFITYASFEHQTLLVSRGIVAGQFNSIPLVSLNAVSSFFSTTTIVGGRGCTVNVGNGDLVNIAGTLNLQDCGSVNLNDTSITAGRSYTLTATGMTAPRPINYANCGTLTLDTGSGIDSIVVSGSPLGTSFIIHGNGGNDLVNLGGGSFDDLLSAVTASGGTGIDILRLDYRQDPDLVAATLRSSTFIANGVTHSYSNFEDVAILAGDGGSDFTIQSVPFLTLPAISTTAFSGGSGDDLLTIGTGNVGVRGNVLVTGGAGSDSLLLDDSTSGGDSTYTFDQGIRFYKGTATYTVALGTKPSLESEVLQANAGDNTISVESVLSPLTVFANGGNDSVRVLDSTRPVTVNTGSENEGATAAPFGDSIEINTDFATSGDAAAKVLVDQDDAVLGLTVAPQGTLRIASGAVLARTAGTGSIFSVGGTIDLAGGALLSRAGASAPDFESLLARGFNAGAWNGTSSSGAINSSTAAASSLGDGVGWAAGSGLGISTIGPFGIDPGDTLLRYTLNGDANLDLAVNVIDLGLLATNWQGSGTAWAQGDFSYDGSVDVVDLGLLASNWQASIAAPASSLARRRPRSDPLLAELA